MPNEPVVDLTIRAARTSDAAALAGLMVELGYQTTESDMQIRLNQMIPDPNYRTFVAVGQGKVRGMIGTFHKVSAKYLPLYVAEFQFRYNNRENADTFGTAINQC